MSNELKIAFIRMAHKPEFIFIGITLYFIHFCHSLYAMAIN